MLLNFFWISMVLLAWTLQPTSATFMRLYGSCVNEFNEAPMPTCESLLNGPCYNCSRDNLIYIFGFTGKADGNMTKLMMNAAINCKNKNVWLVNWEKEAAQLEFLAFTQNLGVAASYITIGLGNCMLVGIEFGNALVRMADTGKFKLDCTTVLAHSLGAHLAGIAGRVVIFFGKIIARISGCDPAREFFDIRFFPIMPPLNKDCAKFVDCIHSDLEMAFNQSVCTADFWVNFGNFVSGTQETHVQPGCPPKDTEILSPQSLCSHNFCIQLWAQSLKTSLIASKAKDYWAWKAGNTTATCPVGNNVDRRATGDYFMDTTDSAPYQ